MWIRRAVLPAQLPGVERADAALVEAIRDYRRLGKTFEARRARMTRVMLSRSNGAEPRRYLTAARRVFKSFSGKDRLRDPASYMVCHNNLTLYALEADELRGARDFCQDLGMPYDAALTLFHLADLFLALGRFWEGQQALAQALSLFQSCQLRRRHVVAALEQLEEAARRKQGMRDAIQQAIARASGIVRRHEVRTD